MSISKGDGSMQQLIDNNQCPRCQTTMPPVDVHGHLQCSVCHLVISECCQGEQACHFDVSDKSGSLK